MKWQYLTLVYRRDPSDRHQFPNGWYANGILRKDLGTYPEVTPENLNKKTTPQNVAIPDKAAIGAHRAKVLNTIGQEGWELVAIVDHCYTFKKPLNG
jgi:hypothetical protein